MRQNPAVARPLSALPVMPAERASAPPGVLSLGGKLASATIVLMVIVAAAGYWKLSAYEQENLLQGKQTAALAVTHLFADSCAAPIVFGDTEAINEDLHRLVKSGDISYAAVWSSAGAGRATQRLAEIGVASDIAIEQIPKQVEVRREPDRLVLVAPVNGVDGQLVGAAVAAFSLVRENAVIAQVQRSTLYTAGGLAVGLTLLLLIIARIAIVRPLAQLLVAANALERGETSDIEVRSGDEIGQLAVAFKSMAHAIENREERIVARNRDMRLVLDNVGQGFLTLDLQAVLSEERSRVVEEWFGTPKSGATLGSYLARLDERVAERFEVAWMLVTDPDMPFEASLEHLPRTLHVAPRIFELAYRPILKDDQLAQMVVVITDITARVERERALVTEREAMNAFKRIVSDRQGFEEFFEEASVLVLNIVGDDGSDRTGLRRDVHTLKGSTAVYGLESIAELCHDIENELEPAHGVLTHERRQQLEASWARVGRIHDEFSADPGITVGREELRALVLALEGRGLTDFAALLGSWQNEPAARRLELIGRQIQLLARRLGKGDVHIRIEPTDLRLPPQAWGQLWTVVSHIVRNTVDHGIEIRARRIELGKPEQATVWLSLVRTEQQIVWSIRDDGHGIDWAAIAQRARYLGLPAATPRDLAAALFSPGVSSKDEVTTLSGRGVGLSAVRDVVSTLGGRVEVESELGKGTQIAIYLPLRMLESAPSPGRQRTPSGRPVSLAAANALGP
jgi:signal transduction histidine kinase